MTRALRYAAAGPSLELLFVYGLFELEQRWVTAGRCVVHSTAVGGHQWHAGIVGDAFGVGEGVRGAVTKVTVQQGVVH